MNFEDTSKQITSQQMTFYYPDGVTLLTPFNYSLYTRVPTDSSKQYHVMISFSTTMAIMYFDKADVIGQTVYIPLLNIPISRTNISLP